MKGLMFSVLSEIVSLCVSGAYEFSIVTNAETGAVMTTSPFSVTEAVYTNATVYADPAGTVNDIWLVSTRLGDCVCYPSGDGTEVWAWWYGYLDDDTEVELKYEKSIGWELRVDVIDDDAVGEFSAVELNFSSGFGTAKRYGGVEEREVLAESAKYYGIAHTDETDELRGRGFVDIKYDGGVVSATNEEAVVTSFSPDHTEAIDGSGNVANGFRLYMYEYIRAMKGDGTYEPRRFRVRRLSSWGRVYSGPAFITVKERGTTNILARSDTITYNPGSGVSGKLIDFPFSDGVWLEADRVYDFELWKAEGEYIPASDIRLYSTVPSAAVPSFGWLSSGSYSARPTCLFRGGMALDVEAVTSVPMMRKSDMESVYNALLLCKDLPGESSLWVESGSPNNNGSNYASITFKPSEFGMETGDRMSSFTVRARQSLPSTHYFDGYALLYDAEDTTSPISVSRQTSNTNSNFDVEFEMSPSPQLDTSKEYKICFSSTAASLTQEYFAMRCITGTASPNLYIDGNTSARPVMSVKFFRSVADLLYEAMNE